MNWCNYRTILKSKVFGGLSDSVLEAASSTLIKQNCLHYSEDFAERGFYRKINEIKTIVSDFIDTQAKAYLEFSKTDSADALNYEYDYINDIHRKMCEINSKLEVKIDEE
jgi:hypothetical protein